MVARTKKTKEHIYNIIRLYTGNTFAGGERISLVRNFTVFVRALTNALEEAVLCMTGAHTEGSSEPDGYENSSYEI